MASLDDVLFEQVLWNIFENAHKYTPEGSPIHLSAHAQDTGVAIDITDSGPSFAPGEETLVWDKFYRGGSKGMRGAGLGLPICKAIVQAHGGRIKVANRPGGGALIHIWISNDGTPPETPNGWPAQGADHRGRPADSPISASDARRRGLPLP